MVKFPSPMGNEVGLMKIDDETDIAERVSVPYGE